MIGYFDGDDFDPQVGTDYGHDYFAGERIIVDACFEFGLFAKKLLDSTSDCGTVRTFDHRCFWLPLMLLNAVWRFREYECQMNLPFDGIFEPVNPEGLKERWFEWLRKETSTWVKHPLLVRQVLLILSNANQPIGYEAEDKLADYILRTYGDVPWSKWIIRDFRKYFVY
jgi:hypothetical protein